MQLYGNGVTKNFLTILEAETRRSRRTIVKVLILSTIVALIGLLALQSHWWLGVSILGGTFLVAGAAGVAWGHFVNTYRYQASIREHWNRWMRFSVSCVSVRECYKKVHGRAPGLGVLTTGFLIALLLVAHLVLGILSLNEGRPLWQPLGLLCLDAALLGSVAGIRWRERQWYREFLKSVNELLQEGAIGVWGVY
jgi:hypothetical protein